MIKPGRTIFMTMIWILPVSSYSQPIYEPVIGATGYDFTITGELNLEYHSTIIDKVTDINQERTYHIKSLLVIRFNRNDLLYFKAQPEDFIGYVENRYESGSGFGGGLISVLPYGSDEGTKWMSVTQHLIIRENEELKEIRLKGETCPMVQVSFSIPDYPEKYKAGLDDLMFRITFAGFSNFDADCQRNVVVEYNSHPGNINNVAENFIDEETLKKLEVSDPSIAAEMRESSRLIKEAAGTAIPSVSVELGCGTFYGLDLANALVANNLVEATGKKKDQFIQNFEQNYFRGLPLIKVLPLIDFLIHGEGIYEIPFEGAFASNSESGSEKVFMKGTLIFYSN